MAFARLTDYKLRSLIENRGMSLPKFLMVDCSVVGKKQLPPDSRLAVSYPLSSDYASVEKFGASGDEVHGMALSRKGDCGHRSSHTDLE